MPIILTLSPDQDVTAVLAAPGANVFLNDLILICLRTFFFLQAYYRYTEKSAQADNAALTDRIDDLRRQVLDLQERTAVAKTEAAEALLASLKTAKAADKPHKSRRLTEDPEKFNGE